MSEKHMLIVLGGAWHDFDGFLAAMLPVFETAGHRVDATHDLDMLAHLHGFSWDVVLLYTCLGAPDAQGSEPAMHTAAQIDALAGWVRDGGGLLAAHAATVACQHSPALRSLIGGVFVSHPPRLEFTIYPTFGEHPITRGIEAFSVCDELYMETSETGVDVHMVALEGGAAYPMVWSRNEGRGRVAHVAPGHDIEVWSLQSYQRLMLQAVDWLIDS